MIELKGSYWYEATRGYDCLVCTTNTTLTINGHLVMGAGIAKQFKGRFYDIAKIFGKRLAKKEHLNGFMVDKFKKVTEDHYSALVAAFPTKRDWRDDSIPSLIIESARILKGTTNVMGWKKVLMTRPGCSNGGLSWDFVKKDLIGKILDDERFVVINNE